MKKSFSLFIGMLILGVVLTLTGCQGGSQPALQSQSRQAFEFRERLSDYRIFNGKPGDQTVESGWIHYDLASPLFTDYAIKDRFIHLPKGHKAAFAGNGLLDLPDSTLIVKNFSYKRPDQTVILIETRMLAKDPTDHQWKVMDYLWNQDQTDAVRHVTGAKIPITLVTENGEKYTTSYTVPNTNDCKRCHINNGILTPIGPKARNLNFTLSGHSNNQLTEWDHLGMITGLPDPKKVTVLPDWKDDANFSLDARARAYLDVNCAHCHNPGGDASNTGLFLEFEQTDPNHLGIRKSPVSAGGGAGGLNVDIIPGDATHSIFAYRMNSIEAGTAMPELGRTLIHKEGVALITQWINQMAHKTKS